MTDNETHDDTGEPAREIEFFDLLALDDVPQGEIKACKIGDLALVVARTETGVKAYDGKCPHKDAPMERGTLCKTDAGEEVLVCPWHRAVFSAQNGALKEPLAFKGLRTYPVKIENNEKGEARIFVSPEPEPLAELETPDADFSVLIVGGGAAAAAACDELRQNGFKGQITIAGGERELPYDRTVLSKNALLSADADQMKLPLFLSGEFYETHKIKFLDQTAKSLDAESGEIVLSDDKRIHADKILICTGAEPKKLDIAGAELKGVTSLRTQSDAQTILSLTPADSHIVLIGSGLINLEIASSLRQKGVGVTIICRKALPLEERLGREIAGRLKQLHEENGVAFIYDSSIAEIKGRDAVEGVLLTDGTLLPCHCVVFGIGVKPASSFVGDALPTFEGMIVVENDMKSGTIAGRDFYAAGDVSANLYGDYLYHVEHIRHAEAQARRAARAMLGLPVDELPVPWFWTQQFGRKLEYVGWGREFDQVSIEGDIRKFSFFCTFSKKGHAVAFASSGQEYSDKMARACVDFRRDAGE